MVPGAGRGTLEEARGGVLLPSRSWLKSPSCLSWLKRTISPFSRSTPSWAGISLSPSGSFRPPSARVFLLLWGIWALPAWWRFLLLIGLHDGRQIFRGLLSPALQLRFHFLYHARAYSHFPPRRFSRTWGSQPFFRNQAAPASKNRCASTDSKRHVPQETRNSPFLRRCLKLMEVKFSRFHDECNVERRHDEGRFRNLVLHKTMCRPILASDQTHAFLLNGKALFLYTIHLVNTHPIWPISTKSS